MSRLHSRCELLPLGLKAFKNATQKGIETQGPVDVSALKNFITFCSAVWEAAATKFLVIAPACLSLTPPKQCTIKLVPLTLRNGFVNIPLTAP